LAKRILIYTNHYYPEQFKINDLVNWISKDDFEVRVITGLPNYPEGKIYKGYGPLSNFLSRSKNKKLKVNRLLLIPRMNGTYALLILNYISFFISCFIFTIYLAIFKKKYDIIFVHHTSPFLISFHPIIYGLFHKTKKIIWELDLWPDTLKGIGLIKSDTLFKLIEKIIMITYSFYDLIMVGSKSFEKIIRKRFNKKIIYFPNWAENDIENPKKSPVDLSLPKNSFRIMYTGNIGTVQNFDKLTKTINNLKNENIHWIFIGAGRYVSDLKKIVKQNALIDNVTFISNVNIQQIPGYSNYADCMYLSLKDSDIFKKTVPAKLQTYMALGKPILAVLSGEGASVIKQANCGYVNENNNFSEFSQIVLKMSKLSEEDLNKMGNNSLNYYNRNFKSSLRKKEFFKLLNNL
jgi:glycosyltransferase involved in cell wall biosynthesis